MPTRRCHVLVAPVSLCLLAGLATPASAGVAIELFNPYNHGFGAGPGNPGVSEIDTNRVPIAHRILFPALGDLGDTDFKEFRPFYGVPSDNVYIGAPYSLENYAVYDQVNVNPFASLYRHLHLGTGGTASTAYFDVIERRSSALLSPGFSANSASYTLDSPRVDTGVGSATGSVSANGEMALKVDIRLSGLEGTPVAEGALQGTYTDKFKVIGSGPTAATTITFGARASAPTLDFSDGDFYNYAVGYQMAVFQRQMLPRNIDGETGERVGPLAPVITEHWSDTGLYWMDARLVRDPFTQLPEKIRIESLGEPPPGVEGVDYTKDVLSYKPTFASGEEPQPWAYRYTREIAIDPANALNASYDDPMMPFSKTSISGKYEMDIFGNFGPRLGDIELPTGVELELVVNFFVIAGCSDDGFDTCEISIDGSHTAGVGIKFADPEVSLLSVNGFSYPQTALVPEPETYALMLGGLALLGWVAKRRKG